MRKHLLLPLLILTWLRWKFRPQFVMDGNFAAEYMQMKLPEDDVWLSDGSGFFVKRAPYQAHLKGALNTYEVRRTHQ